MNTTFSTTGLAQTTGSTRRVSSLFRRYWGALQERRKHQRLRATLCDADSAALTNVLIGQDGSADAQISVASCFLFVRSNIAVPADGLKEAAGPITDISLVPTFLRA